MRLLLGGVLTAALLCSSCMASANKGKRPDDNSNPLGRIEALTKYTTKTMAEVSADMLPILGAVGKEVLLEAQSDVPKVAKERQPTDPPVSSKKVSPGQPLISLCQEDFF